MKKPLYADVYVNTPLDKSFLYAIPSDMEVAMGQRVNVNFAGRNTVGFVSSTHSEKIGDFEVKPILSVIDLYPIFDKRLVKLVHYLSHSYVSSMGEAFFKALPSLKKQLDVPTIDTAEDMTFRNSLTHKQMEVYENIASSNEEAHLIYGVTGSGKTEVYIKLAMDMIHSGKSVIFMVPEIGLSSQIYVRLQEVFGDLLVIYHSLLNAKERYERWVRFYRGDARIVIGTRSAVFMQCPDLGLVIIDEEHDGAYKEQSTPRYSAKRLAFFRAKWEGAKLVMGSATPSLETFHAAKQGVLGLHILDERYGERLLPEIELVKVSGQQDEISGKLKVLTNRAVREGRQVILLLNRRGFSPVVICGDCSEIVMCPHCNVGMNYHRNKGLLCHYCGNVAPLPKVCPKCGAENIHLVGSGTQKIEELAAKDFPNFNILRMDQDSAKRKNSASELVRKMNSGEVDILLGTQMIAKGFDFPKVGVAGVLMADIGLNLPDFRASEKIFSLLVQLAGRSGRGSERGKVIIQTLNPDHSVFKFVLNQDYFGFFENEMEMREALNYPPFSRITRLVVRGKDEDRVEEVSHSLGEIILETVKSHGMKVEVLGPTPAPLSKTGGNFRYHIVLKSATLQGIPDLLRQAISRTDRKKVYIEVDIDAVDMI